MNQNLYMWYWTKHHLSVWVRGAGGPTPRICHCKWCIDRFFFVCVHTDVFLYALVASVTSHRLPRCRHLPYGHSSPCQSNADSGPRSVALMFSSVRGCMRCLLFWETRLFPFTYSPRHEESLCWQRSEGGSQERSRAAATGRGHKGWQCLRVATPVNTNMLDPGWRSESRHEACKTVNYRGAADIRRQWYCKICISLTDELRLLQTPKRWCHICLNLPTNRH